MAIKPITGVRCSYPPHMEYSLVSNACDQTLLHIRMTLTDSECNTDAPKGPSAGSQHRWWFVRTMPGHITSIHLPDQHPAHLLSEPHITKLLAIPHPGPSADISSLFIQVSAPRSATSGGTASTSPASENEISSTPSSRINEQGMLAFDELLRWSA
jgi:hypothetical protein